MDYEKPTDENRFVFVPTKKELEEWARKTEDREKHPEKYPPIKTQKDREAYWEKNAMTFSKGWAEKDCFKKHECPLNSFTPHSRGFLFMGFGETSFPESC